MTLQEHSASLISLIIAASFLCRYQTREVVVKTINIMKTLLRTLASRTAVSESAKELQVPGLQVTLGRETPCGLAKKDLKTPEGQEFTLPDNIKYAFGNTSVEWVEYHVSASNY